MIVLVAAISFAVWVYLVVFHGRFWRSGSVLDAGAASGKAKVAVVVPARNEVESIGCCVRSLLAQDYEGELAVLVVDDNSTDGTGEIAASAGDRRLTVIKGEPLPAGWSGKLWAVHQGLSHAKAAATDYVLLTDADIEHDAGHLSALVAQAERDGLELVSEMVRLHCQTFAERALIPAFVFFFQMLYPFAWVADPARREAGAAGGTMLVARTALDRIEGVGRIRGRLIDDCAMAREIKSTGGRIWLGHAELARSLRIYPSWRDVWKMIARTAYEQLRHSPLMLLGCVAGMGVIYCAPPLIALFAHGAANGFASGSASNVAQWLGILSWLMMAAAFQPTLRRYRRSPLWGAALPAIGLFYLCATVDSALRYYSGRGGGWKSRVYSEKAIR
jgi:hopene-associated glycosyltransferase HpnB